MEVLTRARQYHRLVVARWEPSNTGPNTAGSMLDNWTQERILEPFLMMLFCTDNASRY